MTEMIGTVLHGLNIILTLALLFVYVQNYMKMKSKYTLGLMVFVSFFLIQSVMGLYFDVTMVMYSSSGAQTAATFLEVAKAIGFAVLLWISLD